MALPSGYTELTYIQSSGTQYIDTYYPPNYSTRVVIDCEPTETASAQRAIFGARNSTSGQASLAFGFNIMNSTTCRSDYMGSNASISGTYSSGTRMSVDMNKNVCTVNGKTGTNTAKTSGQTPYNLFLFNVNNVGTPHSSFGFKGKIYSCKIYDNGTLVRDFVPCKNSSGTVGLYDVKNNDFYTNSGTGTFAAGDVVSGGGGSSGGSGGHKTLVNGTAYAISGGKVRVNGTAYEIAGGKTLVNGTVYDIAFFKGFILQITGTSHSDYAYVTLNNDTRKYFSETTIDCEEGTKVTVNCYTDNASYGDDLIIRLNGKTVATGQSGRKGLAYSFVPNTRNVKITLNCISSFLPSLYTADITTS